MFTDNIKKPQIFPSTPANNIINYRYSVLGKNHGYKYTIFISAFDPVTAGELQLPINTMSSAASLSKAKFNNLYILMLH